MTAFEKEFADNLRPMHQIDLFSNCAPPVLLHHHSLCHELFEYAADRCLACQDVFLYVQHNDTYIATASRPRADLFFFLAFAGWAEEEEEEEEGEGVRKSGRVGSRLTRR